MRKTEIRLVKLVLDNGKCPLQDWLDNIRDKLTRARIQRQIDKLSRSLGTHKGLNGIAELKMDFGPGYRVYFGFLEEKTIVVLLGGGDKSSQNKDIAEARRLWADLTKEGVSQPILQAWREEQPIEEGNENETEEL